MSRAVVVGASGFVGSHVCKALEARGVEVIRACAPRLAPMSALDADTFIEGLGVAGGAGATETAEATETTETVATTETADASGGFTELLDSFRSADVVINAAGDPDASSRDSAALIAANGALPGLLGRLAVEAGAQRFVHVSSAVVQGRRPVLDASDEFDAFSAYAKSKALGERFARRFGPAQTVCYRPPSVHHESRRVTRLTARIAASPLSSVAVPGSQPTPQALAANVGAAVAELATIAAPPPAIVIHPWESLSCERLLELLGSRSPRRLPRWFARALVGAGAVAGRLVPAIAANARRIEMVWFGQGQAMSWLTEQGWVPPVGEDGWARLRQRLEQQRLEQQA